jgi:hypothetical protein
LVKTAVGIDADGQQTVTIDDLGIDVGAAPHPVCGDQPDIAKRQKECRKHRPIGPPCEAPHQQDLRGASGGCKPWLGILTKPSNPDRDIDGEEEPTNERLLKVMKSNYSEAGGKMRLDWSNGVFVRTDLGLQDSMQKRYEIDKMVIEHCRALVDMGALPLAAMSASSMVSMLKKRIEFRGLSMGQLMHSQERLLAKRELMLVDVGPKSNTKRCVRPVDMKLKGEV